MYFFSETVIEQTGSLQIEYLIVYLHLKQLKKSYFNCFVIIKQKIIFMKSMIINVFFIILSIKAISSEGKIAKQFLKHFCQSLSKIQLNFCESIFCHKYRYRVLTKEWTLTKVTTKMIRGYNLNFLAIKIVL